MAGDRIDLKMGGTGLLSLVEGANVQIEFKSGKGLRFDGPQSQAALVCESNGATDVFSLVGEVIP